MEDMLKELVTTDSLIDTGRIPRRPAVIWLEDLRSRLLALDRGDPFPDASTIQNNISLLALLLRGPGYARMQCWKQIEYARCRGRAEEIIQPWINLARLDRLQRRQASAVKRLIPLRRLASGEPAALAGLLVSANEVQRLAMNVYAVESFQWALRTPADLMLHLRKLPELFATSDHPAVAEQQIVGGALLSDDEMLRSGLTSSSWFASSQMRFVGMYYRAVIAWSNGDTRPVDRFFELVIRHVDAGERKETDHAWLRLLHRSQLFALRSTRQNVAAELGSRVHALATRVGDVEYAVQSAYALGAIGFTPGNDAAWRPQAEQSGYGRFKGVPPFRVDASVSAEARSLLDEIVGELDRIRGLTDIQYTGEAP